MKSIKKRAATTYSISRLTGLFAILVFTILLSAYSNSLVFAHTASPSICNDLTCNVDVRDNFFQPVSLSVQVPDPNSGQTLTIIWQNHGVSTHTVTSGRRNSPDGVFDQTLAPGDTYQLTLDQNILGQLLTKYPDGIVPYHCIPHFGMDATLIIRSSNPSQETLSAVATPNPSTIQSGQTSTISVQVTSNEIPVAEATVTLTSDNGGILSQESGTTDAFGYFTTTLTAPSVTTQTTVTIIVIATKAGYNDGTGQATVTVTPSSDDSTNSSGGSFPVTNLGIYLAAVVAVAIALGAGFVIIRRMRRR